MLRRQRFQRAAKVNVVDARRRTQHLRPPRRSSRCLGAVRRSVRFSGAGHCPARTRNAHQSRRVARKHAARVTGRGGHGRWLPGIVVCALLCSRALAERRSSEG